MHTTPLPTVTPPELASYRRVHVSLSALGRLPGPCHIGDMWGHVRCDRTVGGAPGLVVFGRADATPPMMTVSKPGIVSRSRARVPIFPYPDALSGGVSRSGW